MTTPLTSRPARRRRPTPSGVAVLAAATALTVFATACGGDDESTSATSVEVSTAAPAPSTTLPVSTTAAATSDTADLPPIGTGDLPPVGTGDLPPIGTGDIPLPPVTADVPYPLSVTVGVDDDPDRIERVPLGATVTITVTNPASDDEFHLHGFDLGDGQVIPAGQPASFTFVADQVGSFELESHETGDVLLVLEVV